MLTYIKKWLRTVAMHRGENWQHVVVTNHGTTNKPIFSKTEIEVRIPKEFTKDVEELEYLKEELKFSSSHSAKVHTGNWDRYYFIKDTSRRML